jgi:LPS O-antigen subunit length determinant protein (WzzB/FepE family)
MAPDMKSNPKRAQMVIVAFMVSLFLGVFVVLFREYLKKIKAKSAGGPNAE